MNRAREIEKSIIKKYRKSIWGRFIKGIKEFQLIEDGDKIAVCISGGKDSFLLAKCLEEFKRHGLINFELVYLVMNPGYKDEHLKKIKENASLLEIEITIFNSKIFDIVDNQSNASPCYLCARMRRGALYSEAKKLGCNKIALGHHFNDIIETIMLNVLYAGQYKSMMPKIKSTNYEKMELIRPLYYVHEKDIIAWTKYNNLDFINCACRVTEKKVDSKRREIKELIETLKKSNENVDISILRSAENVNIDAVVAYKKNGSNVNFLDDF